MPTRQRRGKSLGASTVQRLTAVPPEVERFGDLRNPNTRKACRGDIRDFSAVHGDQVQVADENVRTLDAITVLFLRRVIARAATLTTKAELANWILQAKFA